MPELINGPEEDPIEILPVVVLSQTFPARPSSIPDIRDFVRRCLAESPLTEEGNREVGATVFRALLDAAGPTGSIQVSFRIYPDHVEVDVLHSDLRLTSEPGPRPRPAPAAKAPRPQPGAMREPRTWTARRARRRSPNGCRARCAGRASPTRRRHASWGVGQDGRPLGRRRDRAADAGSAPHPGTVRRTAIPLEPRTSAPVLLAVAGKLSMGTMLVERPTAAESRRVPLHARVGHPRAAGQC